MSPEAVLEKQQRSTHVKGDRSAGTVIISASAQARDFLKKCTRDSGKIKNKKECNIPVLKNYVNYLRNKILVGKVHYLTSFVVTF